MVLLFGYKIKSSSLGDLIDERKKEMEKYYDLDEVAAIRSWLQKQPHLPEISDDAIILFLNSRQFRLERTKRAIEDYCTMRTHARDLFGQRKIKNYIDPKNLPIRFAPYPLDAKTYDGHNIVHIGLPWSDPSKFDFHLLTKFGLAMWDLQVAKNPLTCGIDVVLDSKYLSFAHVGRISVAVLKKIILYMQRGLAVRLKAFHVLNASPATQQALELIRPLAKSHLMKKVHVYRPSEIHLLIEKYIPESVLSCDYGGYGESIEKLHNDMCEELLSVQDWLDDFDKLQIDESKKLERKITSSDIFGMEGSFRKLSFD